MSAAWRGCIIKSVNGEAAEALPPSPTIKYHRTRQTTSYFILHPADDGGPFASLSQPASNKQRHHKTVSASSNKGGRLPKVTPAPSKPRTLNSGIISTCKPVRGLVTRKPDQQSQSEAGGRLGNLQGWRLWARQSERNEATFSTGGGGDMISKGVRK